VYIRSNNGAGIDSEWRTDFVLIGQSTSVKIEIGRKPKQSEEVKKASCMNTKLKTLHFKK
jgi:hypothetical protein